jgi:hypothetical protein
MEIEFSRQIFEKYINMKLNEGLSKGSRVGPCWRTDGQRKKHDEANNNFLQICEHT